MLYPLKLDMKGLRIQNKMMLLIVLIIGTKFVSRDDFRKLKIHQVLLNHLSQRRIRLGQRQTYQHTCLA